MHVAVTGAFGYSGRYIAQRLLEAGHSVMTLTNSVQRRNPFGEQVRAVPFVSEYFDSKTAVLPESAGVNYVIIDSYSYFEYSYCYAAQFVGHKRRTKV